MYLPWSFQENHLLPRVYLASEQSSPIYPLFFSTRTQRSPYLMLASVFWVEVTRLSQNESSWVKLSQYWVTSWVNVESNKVEFGPPQSLSWGYKTEWHERPKNAVKAFCIWSTNAQALTQKYRYFCHEKNLLVLYSFIKYSSNVTLAHFKDLHLATK